MTSAPINSLPRDGAGVGATHALEFNLVKCTRVGNLTPRVKKLFDSAAILESGGDLGMSNKWYAILVNTQLS